LRCGTVAADLQVVLEFLAADRLAFAEERLNFSEDQVNLARLLYRDAAN
jgi:hypothetical protein